MGPNPASSGCGVRVSRESSKTPHHADCAALPNNYTRDMRDMSVVRRTTTLTRRFFGGFAASPPAAPPAELSRRVF